MTETEILRQIVQKMEELIDLYLSYVVIDNDRDREIDNQLIRELADLRQQLAESKESSLDVPTVDEMIDVSDDYGDRHSEDSYGYSIYGVTSNAFRQGAKWAINEIKRRNQK